jgi:hypothetical protein
MPCGYTASAVRSSCIERALPLSSRALPLPLFSVSPYPHRLRGGGAGSIPDRVEESLEPLDLGVEGIGGAEPEQESDVGIGVGVLLLQCESAGGDGAAHGAQPLQSRTQLQMQVTLQGDEGGGRRGGRGAGRLLSSSREHLHMSRRKFRVREITVLVTGLLFLTAIPHASAFEKLPSCELPCQILGEGVREIESCATQIGSDLKLCRAGFDAMEWNEAGMAGVVVARRHHYVRRDGSMLPVITYDNGPDYFSEGLVRSPVDGKLAYFDEHFRQVIPPVYDWGSPLLRGHALVCRGCRPTLPDSDGHVAMQGGTWGYIDRKGREIVPVTFARGVVRPPVVLSVCEAVVWEDDGRKVERAAVPHMVAGKMTLVDESCPERVVLVDAVPAELSPGSPEAQFEGFGCSIAFEQAAVSAIVVGSLRSSREGAPRLTLDFVSDLSCSRILRLGEDYPEARARFIAAGWNPMPAQCSSRKICWGRETPEVASDIAGGFGLSALYTFEGKRFRVILEGSRADGEARVWGIREEGS